MSSTTIIYWPLGVEPGGHCYGWRNSALCVATIAENKTQNLENLGSSQSNPFRLQFPSLQHFLVLYYSRHQVASLRFYSLHAPHTAPHSRLFASCRLDFTRQTRRVAAINQAIVDQFNTARSHEPLSSKPVSRYLFDTMELVLYLPHAISCILDVFPQALLEALSAFSTTVQQIEVRSAQVSFLAQEVAPLRRHEPASVPVYSRRYTHFFNTVWLILNDITIGVAFGSFLCDNNVGLAEILNGIIHSFLIQWARWALHWLDSWPAGLKLNTELSRFYSHAFSDVVGAWGVALDTISHQLPAILFACGIASTVGGMTTAIALLSDLAALSTIHVTLCYHISRTLYARFLRTGGSLWNLFRGKRFNVLRNRTDTWEYDTDQLLFGTILFTLLAFLFPTVLAYYILFALLRLGTILFNAVLETQLAFMNHFPLFALMLRVKDPWRLPHDLYIFMQYKPELHLVVQNKATPLSIIFAQYISLWRKLAAHYNPLRLLWLVLRGGTLGPIPRV
ncbi:Gpi1-domain-containing protein [Mycena kentingensis (nom. inval.)]|nr:Gpi1-domain-containing protein [Mycena kentingensis (nom. inval.)]